jgi:hypothetical protein
MEELLEIQQCLMDGDVPAALGLVDELIEMSKDDKINKIYSYSKILLLHLSKQDAEQRTRSWDLSIANAVAEIQRTNRCRKARGTYLSEVELREALDDAFPLALKAAALETLEGQYTPEELMERINPTAIMERAIALIAAGA